MVGDMLLLHTAPPHIAYKETDTHAVCENGEVVCLDNLPYTTICSALDIVQALERSVLSQHAQG